LPIHIAVRVSYPERGDYDWHQALATYQAIGAVEVAFYRPELFLPEVQVEKVLAPFSTLPLRATSVHMAQAKIAHFADFVAVLRKTLTIAQSLGCSLIVVHPTNGRLAEVEGKIAAVVDPLLAQAGVTLCWETFSGRRRFLSGIEGIAAFCRGREHHAACYDTSHLHKAPGGRAGRRRGLQRLYPLLPPVQSGRRGGTTTPAAATPGGSARLRGDPDRYRQQWILGTAHAGVPAPVPRPAHP